MAIFLRGIVASSWAGNRPSRIPCELVQAAIGMACGLGRESTAILSTLPALVVLAAVPRWVDRKK